MQTNDLPLRHRIVPHLLDYDNARPVAHPHLGFTAPAGYTSPSLNTDAQGFRFSHHGSNVVDTQCWYDYDRAGLLLGGSFSFGVGASSDRATVASQLSRLLDMPFLNAGVRAANSTQELIAGLPFLEKAHTIVLATGVNNLVAHLQSARVGHVYGPSFYEEGLADLGTWRLTDLIDRARTAASWRPRRRSAPRYDRRGGPVRTGTDTAVNEAIRLQIRDLRNLLRMASHAHFVVVIQPFVDQRTRSTSEIERQLLEASDVRQGERWLTIKDRALNTWPTYVERLMYAATDAGAQVVDLSDHEFDGFSFIDRVHMTDHGYEQTAERIAGSIV